MDSNKNERLQKIAEDLKENPDTSLRLIKRFIPLVVFLGLAGLMWCYFQYAKSSDTCDNSKSNTETSVPTGPSNSDLDEDAKAALDLWNKKLGERIDLKLPNGKIINVPENGFENDLVSYLTEGCPGDIKAKWFNCDRLLFNSGSADLNKISFEQIGNLGAILTSFPNAKFKVGGYTDNTGDPKFNKILSASRAEMVMSRIFETGIAIDRLSFEGYGEEHPVCPENDTDDCKAKNRRVAIRVTECQ